ncbi:MAG: high-potential iron sulfur protein 2 [Proteobacteria bacterium]|jgi:hypothetical protein|nr:high-potential iron sulfur protein 2 [Pseudomonadota bacterium]
MTDRRKFLSVVGAGALAVPISTLMKDGVAFAQEAPMVSIDDPTAQALQYIEVSAVDGAYCKDCVLYTDLSKVEEAAGPCALFPGKNVTADGWCISYAKRP